MSKTSLDFIDLGIKDETSKELESLQRSLRLLAETEDIVTHVLEELQVQGEKIDRINENLATIEQKQRESTKLLLYFLQDPLVTNTNQRATTQAPVTYTSVVEQQNKNMVWGSPTSTTYIARSESADSDIKSPRALDSELLLQKLNQALSGVSVKANHIHNTLTAQNEKLDIMNTI